MNNTYLSFIVGTELYAINVIKVLEVLEKQHITPVPNAPPHINGIINFRGDVVPVFDSRKKFNLPERSASDPYVIVVLDLSQEKEAFRIGAVVDKVKDVINIDDVEIKPVPPMSKDFNTEFLNGIYKQNEKFILLLDVERVFTGEEINAINQTSTIEETD